MLILDSAFFIDYEYGMLAPRGFDIGNHFNEFAGFECDYSNYPNKSFQLQWFEWYLTASQGSKYPRRKPKIGKRT
jgi:ethanolamine kinase